MKNSFMKILVAMCIAVLCLAGMVWADVDEQKVITSQPTTEIVVALIALFGIIISVIVSLITSFVMNKIELKKLQSTFSGQLYSKRLEAYLEIYELVSGFGKVIGRKRMSYEEFCKELGDFYEQYSLLDSKSSFLFNLYTLESSSELMERIKEILRCKEMCDTAYEESKKNIRDKLGEIELRMKYELGILGYVNPTATENAILTKTYGEVWKVAPYKYSKRTIKAI